MPKTVGPDWPSSVPCRLAFIGEVPSDEELMKGRPLVGPSGRVFDQMLRTADIVRGEHLVTNVFDRQAPGNDVMAWTAPTKEAWSWPGFADMAPIGKGRYVLPEIAEPALARLADEIARVQPTVLVPMGATALWALTGATNIMATRGAVMQATTKVAPGLKIVPALHPAAVIHEWKMFHVTASDFQKALAQSEFPELRLPKRELWLQPTLADLRHFKARYLDGAELISCDIETGWSQITCIGFAPDAHRSITVPFWDLRRPSRNYWATAAEELEALEWCAAILEGPAPKLFQNGPYDVFWLWDRYGIKVRNYRHDTRLIHHALYPELPKSLEFMGATYATQGPWKLMRPGRGNKRDE